MALLPYDDRDGEIWFDGAFTRYLGPPLAPDGIISGSWGPGGRNEIPRRWRIRLGELAARVPIWGRYPVRYRRLDGVAIVGLISCPDLRLPN